MPIVLVVDDNPGDSSLAGHYLEKIDDVELQYAADGAEAMSLIEQHQPDLVVTDLYMPEIDGLELVRTVRRDHPFVPVVVMTSYGSEEIAVKALRFGAASYVSKNTLEKNLAETVKQVLSVSQANLQKQRLYSCVKQCETEFELENDPDLIPTLIGHLQDNLTRFGNWDDAERTRIGMALSEALDNALYHGNLELRSELREDSISNYYDAANNRRDQQKFADRRIHIIAREGPDEVAYVIRDEGEGFNPKEIPDPTDPENMDRVCGRGLLLINSFMDYVEHNDNGNEIAMRKSRNGN